MRQTTPTLRSPLGQGKPYRAGYRLTLDTDEETLAQIRQTARAERLTMAATVRLLIEWGLEQAGGSGTVRAKPQTTRRTSAR